MAPPLQGNFLTQAGCTRVVLNPSYVFEKVARANTTGCHNGLLHSYYPIIINPNFRVWDKYVNPGVSRHPGYIYKRVVTFDVGGFFPAGAFSKRVDGYAPGYADTWQKDSFGTHVEVGTAEINLNWGGAWDDLKANYPEADGWSIVAIMKAAPIDRDDRPLSEFLGKDGYRYVQGTNQNFHEYIQNQLGAGEGDSAAGYSGSDCNFDAQITGSAKTMHSTGSGNEINMSPSNELINITDDIYTYADSDNMEGDVKDAQVNVPEGLDGEGNANQGWEVDVATSTITIWGSTKEIKTVTVKKKIDSIGDLAIYLKKNEVNDEPVYEEKKDNLDDGAGAHIADPNSYSNQIDGGIHDRSNGQRIISALYDGIQGFTGENNVVFDSLYLPTVSRWGETLDFTDPYTEYNGRRIGKAIVGGRGDFLSYDISVESIEKTINDSDVMTFVENIKYDAVGANIILNGHSSANSEDANHLSNKAFDELCNTYWEADTSQANLMYDFQTTIFAETVLNGAVSAGDTSIDLVDASNMPTNGVLLLDNSDTVSYTTKVGNTLSGIPATGAYAVEDHADGISVVWGTGHRKREIKAYAITGREVGETNHSPNSFLFQASNEYNASVTDAFDDSKWTTLDTQIGLIWDADEEKTFYISGNVTPYRFYRLAIATTDDSSDVSIVNVKMFEENTWVEGDWVYGALVTDSGLQTKFYGTIVSKQRVLSENSQIVRYQAQGSCHTLNKLGFAFEINLDDKNIQEMVDLVVNNIPNSIITGSKGTNLLPSTIIPEIRWQCVTFKRALDMLMEYAGHYGYYIDEQRILNFINLKYDANNSDDVARQVTLKIPAEGEVLDESTSYVMNKDLTIDVSNAVTRCQAIGDYTEIELTEVVPIISNDAGAAPPYAIKVAKSSPISDNNILTDTYLVVLSHNKVQTQLLSDEEKSIDVRVKYYAARYGNIRVSSGWFIPKTNPYNFVVRDQYSAFYINVYKPSSAFKVTYVYKAQDPLFVDTGWIGTAYTDKRIQTTQLVTDIRFKKQIQQGEIIRDDTTELLKYAQQSIAPYRDWYLGGTIELNGLMTTIGISSFVNFSGTTINWANVNAYVKSITWNVNTETTSVELTNNYFMGNFIDPKVAEQEKIVTDSEEIQRILSRLKSLEIENNQF